MPESITTQRLLFPDLFGKPLYAQFDRPCASSDGGAILLKAAEKRLGLIEALTGSLRDARDPGKVLHETRALLSQRIFGLACGYADANDAARLADDPIHKLLLDRHPADGPPLASQPTLSRFENGAPATALLRMSRALFETVLARHAARLSGNVRRVTVDLDVTEDATHGAQQLSFFNSHYATSCYLPLLGFLTFNREKDQYLAAAALRPGNAPTKRGALPLLRRMIPRLKARFPQAKIRVRLDGGFAAPELFAFLEAAGVEYVVGLPGNAVLERMAKPHLEQARALAHAAGASARLFVAGRYKAGRWNRPRRVILKAEVVSVPGREPKDNPRFLVTNLAGAPRRIYERLYCRRGEIENRIKELHEGVFVGRTSCPRFLANQFRVLLAAAAYVLLQEIRQSARGTALARAQVSTLRERLLKIGVQVVVSVRRIVLRLPQGFAFRREWSALAGACGARAG
jgi:hypothetical protein